LLDGFGHRRPRSANRAGKSLAQASRAEKYVEPESRSGFTNALGQQHPPSVDAVAVPTPVQDVPAGRPVADSRLIVVRAQRHVEQSFIGVGWKNGRAVLQLELRLNRIREAGDDVEAANRSWVSWTVARPGFTLRCKQRRGDHRRGASAQNAGFFVSGAGGGAVAFRGAVAQIVERQADPTEVRLGDRSDRIALDPRLAVFRAHTTDQDRARVLGGRDPERRGKSKVVRPHRVFLLCEDAAELAHVQANMIEILG
jgi:hypothetical protein